MNKKLLIVPLVLLFVVVLGFTLINNSGYRVVNTFPKNNSTVPMESFVIIETSEKISSIEDVTISPTIRFTATIEENALKIIPSETFDENTEYLVTVGKIMSESGEELSGTTIRFTAEFVPYSETMGDDRLNTSPSSSGEGLDPLISLLPYENIEFRISVEDYKSSSDKIKLRVELFAILNRPSQYEQFKKDLAQYKLNAEKFIIDNGSSLENYTIEFYPNPADYN